MSILNIWFVELKTFGVENTQYGIIARDDEQEYLWLPASSWDELRAQFPSAKSVIEHVLAQDAFCELQGKCAVGPDGEVSFLDEDEYTGFDEIKLHGAHSFYGGSIGKS